MKKIFIVFFALFLLAAPVFADELVLTRIGTLPVTKQFNQWWFSGTKPTFEGTGSKGANIDITLDGEFKTVKASTEDGKWSFTPEKALEAKDHAVTIASGTKSYSFTLTIGSEMPPPANSPTATELPQTGFLLPALGIAVLAGLLLFLGLRNNETSVS